ncbi:MAG: glutathione peroxidase [Bacteroidetes bacterium]|nr:glutathione peroxidase [Bacteroidota bacterium]
MRYSNIRLILLVILVGNAACSTAQQDVSAKGKKSHPVAASVYDFTVQDIEGRDVSLSQYKGKVLVFLNVASKCGYTSQYADWQAFYEQYTDKGVVVLGFPANNFMGQEPGTDKDIKSFCSTNYNVTFPLFSKISVKGHDMAPLYRYLTETTGEPISWNFNKVLVGKDGKPAAHFKSAVKPDDPAFIAALNKLL